jgi:peptide/nickel transport system ATP-binding protein
MVLVEAERLSKHFAGRQWLPGGNRGVVRAVDGVSFAIEEGRTLGVVGESGCGKTTTAKLVLGLDEPTGGAIRFEGQDLRSLDAAGRKHYRKSVQAVFQDPYASLNPRRRVGDLIAEPLRVHGRRTRAEIDARVRELMGLVGLSADQLQRFPHEFSGGQRQRIGIARALALEPHLIVADEPVSALDVSIQAQIVNLLADLQDRLGLTYVIIAHDLSVIRQVSDRTAVMYLGSIVELGPTEEVYRAPAHPYTQALISAVPVPDVDRTARQRIVLTGDVPSPIDPPAGCRFHPRCRFAQDRCRRERPVLREIAPGRTVACHFPLA